MFFIAGFRTLRCPALEQQVLNPDVREFASN